MIKIFFQCCRVTSTISLRVSAGASRRGPTLPRISTSGTANKVGKVYHKNQIRNIIGINLCVFLIFLEEAVPLRPLRRLPPSFGVSKDEMELLRSLASLAKARRKLMMQQQQHQQQQEQIKDLLIDPENEIN
jgi:hypothetical protein